MGRIRYTPEHIIQPLRTAEIEQGKGLTQEQAAQTIGVTVPTLVRWKQEFGGLKLDQAKRLTHLEQENQRLKKLVANQALDIDILKVATSGTF